MHLDFFEPLVDQNQGLGLAEAQSGRVPFCGQCLSVPVEQGFYGSRVVCLDVCKGANVVDESGFVSQRPATCLLLGWFLCAHRLATSVRFALACSMFSSSS